MLNKLLSLKYRPERGWDPVPEDVAAEYAGAEWAWFDSDLVAVADKVEALAGGLAGKRVLDLGGGPGQYSVEFARRGALVTWHDVSARYRAIAQAKAAEYGVNVGFSLGYLEDAQRLSPPFDVVFNRICWYYCMNDAAFARIMFGLVKPGGCAYIDSPCFPVSSTKAKFKFLLNKWTGLKLGHPCPAPGVVPGLLRRLGPSRLDVNILPDGNEQILMVR